MLGPLIADIFDTRRYAKDVIYISYDLPCTSQKLNTRGCGNGDVPRASVMISKNPEESKRIEEQFSDLLYNMQHALSPLLANQAGAWYRGDISETVTNADKISRHIITNSTKSNSLNSRIERLIALVTMCPRTDKGPSARSVHLMRIFLRYHKFKNRERKI